MDSDILWLALIAGAIVFMALAVWFAYRRPAPEAEPPPGDWGEVTASGKLSPKTQRELHDAYFESLRKNDKNDGDK